MQHSQKERQFKKKKLKVFGAITILVLVVSLPTTIAQTIYLKKSNGEQTGYALSSIRKLTFDSGNLTVTITDNTRGVYPLNEIQYLSLEDYTTNVFSINNDVFTLFAYPNPVGDELNIDLPGKGTIQILNLGGKVVQSKQVNSAGITTLPTGQLSKGLYMCRYSNDKEIKTIKIIKH